MMTRRTQLLLCLAPLQMSAQGILERLGLGAKPSNEKNVSGIKEALLTGLTNAVGLAGRTDGYFGHAVIKILLPDKMKPVEKALRLVGGAKLIDDFVMGMNRAAEQAAPAAKGIFTDAIKAMSVGDAIQILRGGDTAATEFFRKATNDQLVAAFQPPIAESMKSVGAVQAYDQLMGRFKRISFVKAETMDINAYVTGRAVDGLFYLVGEEEKKIRTNPAARVTPLLKEVFGAIAK